MANSRRIVAGLSALLLTVSLSSCGFNSADEGKPTRGSLSEVKSKLAESNDSADEAKESEEMDTSSEESDSAADSADIDPVILAEAEAAAAQVSVETIPDGKLYYTDTWVKAEAPAVLVYGYKYKADLNLEEQKAALEQHGVASLSGIVEKIKAHLVSKGAKAPQIRYEYFDADGNVDWSHTF